MYTGFCSAIFERFMRKCEFSCRENFKMYQPALRSIIMILILIMFCIALFPPDAYVMLTSTEVEDIVA